MAQWSAPMDIIVMHDSLAVAESAEYVKKTRSSILIFRRIVAKRSSLAIWSSAGVVRDRSKSST
jgi:hypothetical protein